MQQSTSPQTHSCECHTQQTFPPPDVHTLSSVCPLCSGPHTLSSCKSFKAEIVPGTFGSDVSKTYPQELSCTWSLPGGVRYTRGCDRLDCKRKHHALLHPPAVSISNQELVSQPTSHQASATILNSATGTGRKRVCLQVVPVRVEGSSGQIVKT